MSADCVTFEEDGRGRYTIVDDNIMMPGRSMEQVRAYLDAKFPTVLLPEKLNSFYYNYSSGYLSINGEVVQEPEQ